MIRCFPRLSRGKTLWPAAACTNAKSHIDRHGPAEMVDVIKAVGAEKCFMSTDLGQLWNPLPVEGLRMFIVTLLKYGINEDEINLMTKTNPAKLLGLSA